MDGAAATEALRRGASQWSLAGDKDLLEALQNLHERIISKCQETNRKLEEMVMALDDANIHLQNVNNKFTALSNSQFIESRVYDDDGDVIAEVSPPKEQPKHQSSDTDIDRLKASLQVLENMHEPVTILCDSDSDSDDDSMTRIVLKPKDLYADRPLPHIIGTQAWKSKWHAGLLPDESDSDSSTKRDLQDEEQFSDSEPDPSEYPQYHSETLGVPVPRDRTISSSSSELHSEPVTHPKPSQSDIAAELARRLGGGVNKIPEQDTEYSPPQPTTRKLYKPEQPAPGAIFSDEPPPLDFDQSEESDQDIFAEIHKNKPYSQSSRDQSSVADDLFGRNMFEDVDNKPTQKSNVKEKSPLFKDELFAANPKPAQTTKQEEVNTKKPIGGMSLFGNNAESIGAAILRRNQRASSTSGEESDSTEPQATKKSQMIDNPLKKQETTESPKEKQTPQRQIERDIFDDLFAKSKEREQKEKERQEKEKAKTVKEPVRKDKKVDLFSDNIFDDIDDIFTSNVVTPKDKEKRKDTSIFDEQDDLFSDIAVIKTITDNVAKDTVSKTSKDKVEKEKGIFSSDEELFSEKTKTSDQPKKVNKLIKDSKSIFDDSDDDLFSDVAVNKVTKTANKSDTVDIKNSTNNVTVAKSVTNDVVKSNVDSKNNAQSYLASKASKNKVEDLFGEDDGESLFTDKKETLNVGNKANIAKETPKLVINDSSESNQSKTVEQLKAKSSKVINSPNLFDDDEMNDLFTSTQNLKSKSDEVQNDSSSKKGNNSPMKTTKSILDNDDDDDLFRTDTKNSSATVKSDDNKNDELQNDDIFKTATSILDEDDDLFKNNTKSNTPVTNDKAIDGKPPRNNTSSLAEARNNNKQDTTKHEAKEVFKSTQENRTDNLPEEDLFKKPNTTPKPKITEKPKDIFDNHSQNSKIGVFDDSDTDVMFNKSTPDTEVTTKEVEIPKPVSASTKDIIPNTETAAVDNATGENADSSAKQMPANTALDNTKEVHANKNITDTPKEDYNELQKDNQKQITVETKTKNEVLDSTPSEIKEKVKEDAFTDIFDDLPPAFEKPKEPKKSKNVNALFDDDSDDENLFFKKNDVTLEEVPEDFSSAADDRLFGLFRDEPPAIDVDFVQKPKKDIFPTKGADFEQNVKDNDVFSVGAVDSVQKSEISKITDVEGQKSTKSDIFSNIEDDEIFKKPAEIDIFGDESNETVVKSDDIASLLKDDDDDNLFKTPKEDVTNTQIKQDNKITKSEGIDKTDGPQAETKKIGKLKPMNFNINVNTLLPGASPKKVAKPIEQTDGQAISSKSNEELRTNEIIEPTTDAKLVKSVSFEGKPESNVLDNKLSKERAKIQVKRRPSTRRARREAVKKSGIDFGEDSTDNSSSIDDQPRSLVITQDYEKLTDNSKDTNIETKVTRETSSSKAQISKKDSNETTKHDGIITVAQITQDELDSQTNTDSRDSLLPIVDDKTTKTDATYSKNEEITNINKNTGTIPKTSPNRNVKSKVVYILNDEDIFNTKPSQEPEEKPKKVLNIVDDDDDDIFKTMIPPNHQKVNISGNNSSREVKPKNILTNDDDDEDIFKTMKPKTNKSKAQEQPKPKKVENILDSDDDNLFKNSSTTKSEKNENSTKPENKPTETQNRKPKSSIFGDLDDEALFTGKKVDKGKDKKKISIFGSDSEEELFTGAKKDKKREKLVEKEFKGVEVKGSLFGDESDDDLFGNKSKKITEPKPHDRSKSTKEAHSKSAEPVFEDPLSLLGGGDD
uniref:FAM21/CAPZIP domain-containing protein n=1 Tax=Pectinophora gossypiella TaxID=13191 RepID=A0A1E1WIX0_PECGO